MGDDCSSKPDLCDNIGNASCTGDVCVCDAGYGGENGQTTCTPGNIDAFYDINAFNSTLNGQTMGYQIKKIWEINVV